MPSADVNHDVEEAQATSNTVKEHDDRDADNEEEQQRQVSEGESVEKNDPRIIVFVFFPGS